MLLLWIIYFSLYLFEHFQIPVFTPLTAFIWPPSKTFIRLKPSSLLPRFLKTILPGVLSFFGNWLTISGGNRRRSLLSVWEMMTQLVKGASQSLIMVLSVLGEAHPPSLKWRHAWNDVVTHGQTSHLRWRHPPAWCAATPSHFQPGCFKILSLNSEGVLNWQMRARFYEHPLTRLTQW